MAEMLRVMLAPNHSRRSIVACGGAVLFAVLVAHLIVMATPLHYLVMNSDRSVDAASMHQAQDDVSLPLGAQLASMDDIGDCAIVWTVLARQAPGFSAIVGAVSTIANIPMVAPHGPPPLPRTLGPPLGADRQAFLQVFRI
jgi:hypothetical protein